MGRLDAILLGATGSLWLYLAIFGLDAGIGQPMAGLVVGLLVFAALLGLLRVRRELSLLAVWMSCSVAFWLFEELITGAGSRWDEWLLGIGMYLALGGILAALHIVAVRLLRRTPPLCRSCSYGGPAPEPGGPCPGCGAARPAPRRRALPSRPSRWKPALRAATIACLIVAFALAFWQGQHARAARAIAGREPNALTFVVRGRGPVPALASCYVISLPLEDGSPYRLLLCRALDGGPPQAQLGMVDNLGEARGFPQVEPTVCMDLTETPEQLLADPQRLEAVRSAFVAHVRGLEAAGAAPTVAKSHRFFGSRVRPAAPAQWLPAPP